MEIGINLILGIGLILYGLYTLISRLVAPEKIDKLQALIETHGTKTATSIHLIGFTIVPWIAGALLLIRHFRA